MLLLRIKSESVVYEDSLLPLFIVGQAVMIISITIYEIEEKVPIFR